MANICTTNIIIINKDREVLKGLVNHFTKAQMSGIKTDYGDAWLGHLYAYLGMAKEQIDMMPCRGTVYGFEIYSVGNAFHLSMQTSTAWGPMLDPIVAMAEKFAPGSEVEYAAEEPQMNLFITNRSELADTVHVSIFEDLPENLDWLYEVNEYGCSKEDFLHEVKESMEWGSVRKKDLDDKVHEELGHLFSFNVWVYVPLKEIMSPVK